MFRILILCHLLNQHDDTEINYLFLGGPEGDTQ